MYLANERASWLPPEWLEHWKVWQRTPPGQTVRNLWGVVEGGLAKGNYRINFLENSPIWEEWGVPERRLILTGNPSWLGNIGAMQTLAGAMFVFGSCELILLISLVVLVFVLKIQPVVSDPDPSPPPPAAQMAPAQMALASQRQREVVHSMRV